MSSVWLRIRPAKIHGRRVPLRSLSQPKTMFPTLAAIAPKKVMSPRIQTLSSPESTTTLRGNRIVRNGT